jgi:hypothetical protein
MVKATKLILDLSRKDKQELGWRANLGIEIHRWCQEQGLERGVDYDWALMPAERELHFKFWGEDPAFATMFALRWSEYL